MLLKIELIVISVLDFIVLLLFSPPVNCSPPSLQEVCRIRLRSEIRRLVEEEQPYLKFGTNQRKIVPRGRRHMREIVLPFVEGDSHPLAAIIQLSSPSGGRSHGASRAKRKKSDSGLGDEAMSGSDDETSGGPAGSDSDFSDEAVSSDDDDIFVWSHLANTASVRTAGESIPTTRDKSGESTGELYARHMRSKILQLPLPLCLKSYLNLNRDF